ncbi:hypothetical protein PX668_01590 [Acinetobacter soli]|nr:hypothetical protein [Acinetobacter soli]WEI14033.1 hypothetical protein PX667_08745 [Acinetobacter soli]WEI15683.1 hypothetical protein PX668_01520 [Acinetobacter soli]WEI15688.1 hypothetical protein PX668_01555 [Acinetobacter soli]WEI15694.1 hypothetical protein PX668_01590 [Acinetobacter soli]
MIKEYEKINLNSLESVVCGGCGVKFKPSKRFLEHGLHKPDCENFRIEFEKNL